MAYTASTENAGGIDAAIQRRQQDLANGSLPGTVGRDLTINRWDNKLPTQEKIVQANQTTADRMANWDYKTAQFGPNGEQLPKGAQGWDPRGNPYFGEGLGGWWRKFKSAMSQPYNLPDEEGVTLGTASSQGGVTTKDVKVSTGSKAVNDALKAGSIASQWSSRVLKEGVIGGGLEVLNQIEEQTERWLGGTAMAKNELEQKSGLPELPQSLPEGINAAVNAVGLNDTKIGNFVEQATRLDNVFNEFAFTSPVHVIYNSLRQSVGQIKAGFQTLRGEETGLTPIDENYEAARMAYTALYDEGRKQEYIRRVQAGENPDLLRMELENPYVEIALGIIIDPIDMLPFELIKSGRAAHRFADEYGMLPELKKVMGDADDFSDAQRTAMKASEFITTAQTTAKQVAGDLDGFRLKNGLFDLTAKGKQAVVGERANDLLKWSANNLAQRDPDEACQIMDALVKLHSDKLDEVGEAVSTLAAQGDAAPLFSRAGFETGYVLKNVMGDNPSKFLDDLKNTESIDDLLNLTKAKIGKTTEAMFPSVRELVEQGENVKPLTKFAANVDFALKGGKIAPVTNINKFFSAVYMGMSPGYAFRNAMTNSIQAFVDLGVKGGAETFRAQISNMPGINKVFGGTAYVDNLAEKVTKWAGGTAPEALRRGFGTPLSAADIGNLGDDTTIFNLFQKISEKAEEGASIAVVSRAFEDAMLRGMREGVAIPKMDELIQAGMTRENADTLIRLITDNYGNVDDAVKAFREATAVGSIDILHTSEWLQNKKDIDFLRQSGAYDSLLDAVKNAKTKDEALQYINDLEKEMRRMAQEAGKEIPVIDPDQLKQMWSGEILQDMSEAVNDGFVKWESGDIQQAVRNSNVILNDAVKSTYEQAARDALESAMVQFPGMPELKDLSKRLTGLSAGPKMHYADFQSARNLRINHIHAIKNTNDPQKLAGYWTRFFKDTPVPDDLTRQVLIDKVWRQYFDDASNYWRLAREQYAGAAEAWFSDLQKITGQTDYPLLTQAREYLDHSHQFDNVQFVMKDGAINWVKGEKVHPNKLINTVNKYLGTDYKKIDEISVDELDKALKLQAEAKAAGGLAPSAVDAGDIAKIEEDAARRAQEAAQAGQEAGFERIQFPYDGTTPSPGRIYNESFKGGLGGMFDRLRQSVNDNWGKMRPVSLDANIDSAMPKWIDEAKARISRQRLAATEIATHTRDKILLNYGKKMNLDMGISYLMPYQFWHTRTYYNWMKRVVTDTPVISAYGKYREMMQSIHAGMPEWWRYNINTNELFGLNSEHPLYFNLEATLNPLNALVGIDFNDEQKRVDYWTAMLDDISKVGPSVWTPLNWATALALYQQGKDDAGARWLGRMIPQTATIKAATSLTGLNTKGGTELDPFVNFIMGGSDPYERNRIGRALASLEGKYTTAQLQEAAQMQSGPIWDEAAQLATNARAPGQLASYFLGVGFKGRSEADMQTDYMYADYFQLMNMRPDLSPQEFSNKIDELRQKYPFMDTVLISRKGGFERDTAYAYTVMRRIPPGQSTAIAELAGIDPRLMDKFFEDKGAIEKWPKQDRDELINGMISIGAVLDLPTTATRNEWTAAKNAYTSMRQQAQAIYGKDIYDKVDGFYNAEDRDAYLKMHPEVEKAMDWQSAYIVNDALLNTYYGGMDKIERYYKSMLYMEAEKKFGSDLWANMDQYYFLKNNGGEYKSYLKAHPEIKGYFDMKDNWDEAIQTKIIETGLMLKEGAPYVIREDLPQDMSFGQQDLYSGLQAPPQPLFSWDQWRAVLPNDIEKKLVGGEELSESEAARLNQKADVLGLDYQRMMEMIYQAISLTE